MRRTVAKNEKQLTGAFLLERCPRHEGLRKQLEELSWWRVWYCAKPIAFPLF